MRLNQENTDLLVQLAASQQVLIDNHLVRKDSLISVGKRIYALKQMHEQADSTLLSIAPNKAGYYKALGWLEALNLVSKN